MPTNTPDDPTRRADGADDTNDDALNSRSDVPAEPVPATPAARRVRVAPDSPVMLEGEPLRVLSDDPPPEPPKTVAMTTTNDTARRDDRAARGDLPKWHAPEAELERRLDSVKQRHSNLDNMRARVVAWSELFLDSPEAKEHPGVARADRG